MDKQPGGHFNAKATIKKLTILSESGFEITLKEPSSAFLFLLSIPEMGIVPREACDASHNIQDLHLTSGAYIIKEPASTDRLVLVKNPFFTRHDAESPDQVILLFLSGEEDIIRVITEEHTDFIEISRNSAASILKRIRPINGYTEKITHPSLSFFLVNQAKNMPLAQRVGLAKLINDDFTGLYQAAADIERRSFEILPAGTFGGMYLESPLLSGFTEKDKLPKRLTVGSQDFNSPSATTIVRILSDHGIKVKKTGLWDGEPYDIGLWGQGMNSDFPEIELYLNLVSPWCIIPATSKEKSLVLRAIHSNSLEDRQKLIQTIGKGLLEDGRVIPLLVRAYVHIFRSGRLNLDRISTDGDIPFWKMKVLDP
jgi:hypothetical protein